MDFLRDEVSIDLRRVLFGIADSLDAVGINDAYHGHRVGYIAYRCAKRMGWDEEQAQLAFYLGLIHDCGVTQPEEMTPLLSELLPRDTHSHCRKGYELLSSCHPLSGFSVPVLHHHTWWQDLSHLDALTEVEKQLAALAFISDRLDYLYSIADPDHFGNLGVDAKHTIIRELGDNSGTLFEPNMVQHLCELVDNDDFWFSMESHYIEDMALHFEPVPFFSAQMGLEETIHIAEFLAQLVDAKSSFTFQHSLRVAELTEFIGKQLGYSKRIQRMLYLAGLVHDIGKLRTPNNVLHKEGRLSEAEYTCIRRHATDTRYALRSMFTSQRVVEWASNHHERLDGSGYPLGKTASELDMPSRIVAMTDVFQALTQSRPYRDGMSLEQAMTIIQQQVVNHQLDSRVFFCLKAHGQKCYEISTGRDASHTSQSEIKKGA
ncbi:MULTISPECIES: HD-GYP domain-containing protein [unclassified Vibrio]|uniref:HD-GYP domain-containing protein n=1 Tax=unclassified Vibrio TaxID=2614977 RepID=UPI0013619213|nr:MULTISPECIES: HD domain-containing phosphohydrolase [unclassified Vibrio]NAW59854.1 HD domain-containing protein [Vibrio sp. V36_P2S2PM302]NAX27659.1 HD domain-containing protein [Vibrio sp. V38_P2S17PM301]NAX31270.1 HD domain-containing protein [Vibrio sp. V37_P2S8PM304]